MAQIILTSKAPFPLPIRTGKIRTIKRKRITRRRDGTSGFRPENLRSEVTLTLRPGKANAISCPAEWFDLPDVKAYRKRGWILKTDLAPTKSDRSDPIPAKTSKPRKRS